MGVADLEGEKVRHQGTEGLACEGAANTSAA